MSSMKIKVKYLIDTYGYYEGIATAFVISYYLYNLYF